MIRSWLVNLPWPQPWPVEAFLCLVLYLIPMRRFAWGELWKAKGQISHER